MIVALITGAITAGIVYSLIHFLYGRHINARLGRTGNTPVRLRLRSTVQDLLPGFAERYSEKRRSIAIDRAAPELIDQMTVLVSSGLSLDLSLRRVAESNSGPLGEELRRTIAEMDVGMARADALRRLSTRMPSSGARRFFSLLRQADAYGVSLSETLALLSEEAYEGVRAAAEEEAGRLPVKMLFPLVFMILPAFLLLTVGPLVCYTLCGT